MCIFPLLHGTFGEDGTIQGLLEMANTAYVGAGVAGSSVGMDKGIFKDVMQTNSIPSVESVILLRSEIEKDMNAAIAKAEKVGAYPIFTKPANLGSSVGVTKCNSRSDLQEGLMEAARFDRRVLVERGVANVREIEVSVLGNEDPRASVPGEVLPSREFYSYESKYMDGTSGLLIPAPLPQETASAHPGPGRACLQGDRRGGHGAGGFLRGQRFRTGVPERTQYDPGLHEDQHVSQAVGGQRHPYAELVDRLIELAMQRKSERDRTSHSYRSRSMSSSSERSRAESRTIAAS